MKNRIRLFGLIAMVAIITFGMASCDNGNGTKHTHDFSGGWTGDSTGHWPVCPDDGAKGPVVAHTPTDGVCTVCNYDSTPAPNETVYTAKADDGSTVTLIITSDGTTIVIGDGYVLKITKDGETDHYFISTGTVSGINEDDGEITLQPSEPEAETFTVTVEEENITDIEGEITSDDGETVNGSEITIVPPTPDPVCDCDEDGEGCICDDDDCDCKNCETDKHKHHFDTTNWKHDNSQHWHECECGEKDDIGNHDFSEWEQTKAPTFTEAGEETEKCSVCGTLGTVKKEVPQLALDSIDAIADYLDTADGGDDTADPIPLKLKLDLGTMGTDANNWTGLLALLNEKGKYVDLDLSGCTLIGTEFSTGVFIDFDTPPYIFKPDGIDSIVSVALPDGITSIGNYAFQSCTSLTSVTIPDSVTTIGDMAFSGTSLTSIDIPDSVTTIGYGAFYNCTGLTSIDIPDRVTTIGDSAFQDCTGLTSVTIPDSVTSIGDQAFQDCTGLTSVTIGSGVKSIGNFVFSNCTDLTSVTIGNGVESIGLSMFRGCTSLTSVTIPASVTSIGGWAFEDCTSLASVTFERADTSFNWNQYSPPNPSFPNAISLWTAYETGGIGTYILTDSTWTKQD